MSNDFVLSTERPQVLSFESIPQREQKNLVRVVEEVLEMAKKGELTTVAISGNTSDGHVYTAWHGEDLVKMLGAIEFVKHDIVSGFDLEDPEEEDEDEDDEIG